MEIRNIILRKLGLLILLCSCCVLKANAVPSEKYSLVVNLKNGTQQTFLLKEKPSIVFQDGKFIISQTGSNVDFSFDNVLNFSFSDIVNSIRTLNDDQLTVSYTDSQHLLVHGAEGNTQISIASLEGMMMPCQVVRVDYNTLSVSLENLPKGVYIISIGKTQNIKIIKK